MGEDWSLTGVEWAGLDDAAQCLAPTPLLTRQAVIPVNGWSLILTNGPLGTDVGMLPSLAARQLGCRGVRAFCSEDGEVVFPARILEVFGPDGSGPLLAVRTIAASNDGGRWVFETTGEPFPFERLDHYSRRRKSDRFTSTLLYEYLGALRVPLDEEPDWSRAILLELRE